MTKRAVIYARVSTDLQRDNYSIPSQVAECQRYIDSCGHSIVGDRFVDPETGRDTGKGNGSIPAYVDDFTSREVSRPGLNAVLDYLESYGFDVMVVYAIDRLARDPYIRETLERELFGLGAKVEYVSGNYEDTPEGEVRKDLDATFAKWENAIRVERSNRGKCRKAESGLHIGGGRLPYGYYADENTPGGLAIIEAQASAVRYIFELYAIEGLSLYGIVERLNQDGIPNHSGKPKWGRSSVTRILKNTTYKGQFFYNKHKRNGSRLVLRDRAEWIEVPVTPIVDEWLFDEAQRRLGENRKLRRRQPKRFYLLSGIVICEECNRPYISQTQKAGSHRRKNEAQSYRHRVTKGHCCNKQISARILEPMVWNEIVKVILDPVSLRDGYLASIKEQEATRERQLAHIEGLRKELIKLDKERQNLNKAYIDPDITLTKAEYIEQKNRIDDTLGYLSNEIEEIEKGLANIPTPQGLETLEVFTSEIRGKIENTDPTPEQKRKLLDMLHAKVIISLDGRTRVDGWFNPGRGGLLSTTSTYCDHQLQQPLGRVSHVLDLLFLENQFEPERGYLLE